MSDQQNTAGPGPGIAAGSPTTTRETSPGSPVAALTAYANALSDPARFSERVTDVRKMRHDASHFALTPRAVATPIDAAEVGRLFAVSAGQGIPLTFRSGGTSLSGQAGTHGILVETRRHFRDIEILDNGLRVRVGPGATVRQVNSRLVRHGRKLGPDPASEIACTLGGVVANNSSGMACGTVANTYNTLESLVLVLPSGTVLDTGASDADERLRQTEPDLHAGLVRLRDRVRSNPHSVATIEHQFSMKNTMGYGLNSFLDHTRPIDILAHLVVGSEGTLAFIASIVMRTVPLLRHAMTGLLVFDTLADATGSLPALVETGPATIELMDSTSLRVGQADPAADDLLRRLTVDAHAALLVEYQADSPEQVGASADAARATLESLRLSTPAQLTADPAARARLWHTRKGLYATVAGARPSGTTALLEDIVVPVPALLPTCEKLTRLLARHNYNDSVIFGHAKDGNIHFMVTEHIDGARMDRFLGFTEDLVDLVLGMDGSLKAEHGTGRMMAPYVRRQYGPELYEVMQALKALFDPRGLLSPGVLLSDDPDVHTRDLKTTPKVEEEVDRCVECGYCEPVCPSKDLTTTPRQRIVLRREMAAARAAGDLELLGALEKDYDYDSIDTCAVDGMCQTACPVHINTGDLVKRIRAEDAGRAVSFGWDVAARHWAGLTTTASRALSLTKKLPNTAVTAPNRLGRLVLDHDVLPLWSAELPRGGSPRRSGPPGDITRAFKLADPVERADSVSEVVYFTACVGAMFGPSDAGPGVRTAFTSLCARAGVTLLYPSDLPSLCCSTPWRSKGLTKGAQRMEYQVLESLWEASRAGTIPVVCDASSCTEGLLHSLETARSGPDRRYAGLQVIDAVTFVAEHVLTRLPKITKFSSLALHPTCSTTRLGINPDLLAVASSLAEHVTIPDAWGCCGFAGDRGLLHPELTASATAAQAAELAADDYDAYASCNRTCELGMTRATGEQYQHILELLVAGIT